MIHGKTTQHAIAAMSRLAELYSDPGQVAASRDIAESRNLPIPIVAKVLTELSRAGLITGSPGPNGGYRLAKPPGEITLQDVAELFEREGETACPYGPGWCGVGEPCPLHDDMVRLNGRISDFLSKTTFARFARRKKKSNSANPKNGRL